MKKAQIINNSKLLCGFSIAVSFGRYGGFYIHNGYTKRICLGWMAVTYFPREIDDILIDLIDKQNRV